MTQVLAPYYARAFKLKALGQTAGARKPTTDALWGRFICAVHLRQCYIKETDKIIVPVMGKWLLCVVGAGLKHWDTTSKIRFLKRTLSNFRNETTKRGIIISRAQIIAFQKCSTPKGASL